MRDIFISAGHSDTDSGAVNQESKEANIVREFRDLVGIHLAYEGVKYSSDGGFGVNLPLREAVKLITSKAIAVEFHLNASTNKTATGVETLSSPVLFRLGNSLCSAVSSRLGIRNRGAKPENSGQHSRLAFVQAGGLILELFFISNDMDIEAYNKNKHELAKDVALILIKEASYD